MSNAQTEAKIFACSQSEELAKRLQLHLVLVSVMSLRQITVTESFNLHLKNLFVVQEYL